MLLICFFFFFVFSFLAAHLNIKLILAITVSLEVLQTGRNRGIFVLMPSMAQI